MLATPPPYSIAWKKLPDDFVLPDDPVDNINQPAIAAALTESLQLAGSLPETAFTSTNYGICATVNGKTVVKAPDWAYVPRIAVARSEIATSYTPHLQGDIPAIVLEFLSDTDGGEYSVKETYPPGKFFFYEQILQVLNYGVFEPQTGNLELYRLGDGGRYRRSAAGVGETLPQTHRFWIPEMQLSLGTWQGTRENRQGYWLRWWDEAGNLLLWGAERIERERQRSERLAAQLRAAGIEPEEV